MKDLVVGFQSPVPVDNIKVYTEETFHSKYRTKDAPAVTMRKENKLCKKKTEDPE